MNKTKAAGKAFLRSFVKWGVPWLCIFLALGLIGNHRLRHGADKVRIDPKLLGAGVSASVFCDDAESFGKLASFDGENAKKLALCLSNAEAEKRFFSSRDLTGTFSYRFIPDVEYRTVRLSLAGEDAVYSIVFPLYSAEDLSSCKEGVLPVLVSRTDGGADSDLWSDSWKFNVPAEDFIELSSFVRQSAV